MLPPMITLGMLRSFLIGSLCIGAACDVGSVLAQQGPDGGNPAGSGDGGTAEAACPALNPTPPSGHHGANNVAADAGATEINPHEGCLGQAGCHNVNLTPNPSYIWDYGGEAYQDLQGITPYAGATVMLSTVGPNPMTVMLPVAPNGFFWLQSGSTFPKPSATVSINATLCVGTNKLPMSTSLAAVQAGSGTDGNCNAVGCHGNGTTGGYIALTPE